MNTTQIQQLLRPGLAAITGFYPTYPTQWSEIYESYSSDKAFEQEVEMKFTGFGAIQPEGSPVQLDDMGSRTTTTYTHRYVSLGFVVTRQAQMDNLYKSRFPMMAKALVRSVGQTKEVLGASVINNGFTTNGADGVPFFSSSHPIDIGTVSNTLSNIGLNEASLETALVQIQQFRDRAGLLCNTKAEKLIVPPALQFTAERLLASSYRTGVANNDVSAIYNMQSVKQGFRVNQYLTSSLNWFILTDAPDGMKYYEREKLESDVYTDWSTSNLMCKVVERYSFGFTNFRGMFGVTGA